MKMTPDPEKPNLTCAMGNTWPPIQAKVYGPDPEATRPHVGLVVYEKVRTWHLVCGLFQMDGSETGKCLSCKHALVDNKPLLKDISRMPTFPAARSRTIKPLRGQ